jgi:hypothetical protein
MTLKELLIELKACEPARKWAGDKSIEEVVASCHRGDWLLWLAVTVNIGEQKIYLAAGLSANTVRHLMKDKRSIAAVDAAIAYGNCEISAESLKNAAAAYADAVAAAYADAAVNKLQTADICRDVFSNELIDRVNQMLAVDEAVRNICQYTPNPANF